TLTGRRIFEEFAARIAGPLGMQDFELADGYYLTGPDSIHPAYPFRMTARDLTRFGTMYLNGGGGILPEAWVRESTTAYSNAAGSPFEAFGGYGYMWWVEEGSFSAFGIGGHRIMVVPAEKLVIVHRVATETPDSTAVSDGDLQKLCRMIRGST
ncbi:MAG: class C beta-lactamase-related serine hydrolase, partial [Bryobacterales bacterium]|nr:class C beta-lactamase-related serine hydrolase [Bryobacterales bacterium]